jgi:hypothetical protein
MVRFPEDSVLRVGEPQDLDMVRSPGDRLEGLLASEDRVEADRVRGDDQVKFGDDPKGDRRQDAQCPEVTPESLKDEPVTVQGEGLDGPGARGQEVQGEDEVGQETDGQTGPVRPGPDGARNGRVRDGSQGGKGPSSGIQPGGKVSERDPCFHLDGALLRVKLEEGTEHSEMGRETRHAIAP